MAQNANHTGLLTGLPIVDEVLSEHASESGNDLIAYRNHVYRVVNLCVAIAGDRSVKLEKIAVAAVFHVLGIWTNRTFDYIAPSVTLAREYLAERGRAAWISLSRAGHAVRHVVGFAESTFTDEDETAMTHVNTVPGAASINHQPPSTRRIAGIAVPDTPLITAVVEFAQRLSEPYLFNHAMRSWLFAEVLGVVKGIAYDREVVAIGTILHDIGLTASVSGPNRFEVNGADAALSFIRGKGLSDRRAQLIWDLVALNSTPSLALHKEPEVVVGTMGIGLDYGGFGIQALPAGDLEGILSAFPRLKMKQAFAATCCRLVTAKPETSHDNFLRDFGERFVPGYKAVSTVDLLMNAPFEE